MSLGKSLVLDKLSWRSQTEAPAPRLLEFGTGPRGASEPEWSEGDELKVEGWRGEAGGCRLGGGGAASVTETKGTVSSRGWRRAPFLEVVPARQHCLGSVPKQTFPRCLGWRVKVTPGSCPLTTGACGRTPVRQGSAPHSFVVRRMSRY